VCIIAHGSSGARAIENGINVACDLVKHDMVIEIRDAIAGAAPTD
jgi:fatty acid/phospholipid biosynthesis enzyme